MTRYAFYTDVSACSGCKTCQAACRDKNNLNPGVRWRRVYEITGGEWSEENGVFNSLPFSYFLPVSCMNCISPPCVSACPTKAMNRDENDIVTVDTSLCMGCRYCEWACPYGVPQYDTIEKVVTKCDLCRDYILDGKKPACVDSCPMRALDFGSYDTLKSAYGNLGRVFPLPDPDLTKPGIILKAHKDSGRAEIEKAYFTDREDI